MECSKSFELLYKYIKLWIRRGLGLVIEGLDLAVGSMKLKEQSEFIISPDLAWGEKGCPPRIPANSYVYFKVDMIEWIDSSAAEAYSKLPMNLRKEVSFEKVLEAAKSEKRKGTAYFEKQSHQSVLFGKISFWKRM